MALREPRRVRGFEGGSRGFEGFTHGLLRTVGELIESD